MSAAAGSWFGDAWSDITTPQPVPSTAVVLGTAAVVLVILAVPVAWHVARHGLTIVHEAFHAGVAVLVGRRLSGIKVHSDTSGLTVSSGKPRGPGMVATAAAGYTGPALLGLGAAALLSQGYAVALLWLLLVVLVLVLVQIRNWYGLWSVLVTGALVVAVTVWGSSQVQLLFAYLVTWFLLLGAPRAVIEMQAQRRRRRGAADTSDAGMLGRLTHTPGGLWVGILFLLCVGALVLGASWLADLQL